MASTTFTDEIPLDVATVICHATENEQYRCRLRDMSNVAFEGDPITVDAVKMGNVQDVRTDFTTVGARQHYRFATHDARNTVDCEIDEQPSGDRHLVCE